MCALLCISHTLFMNDDGLTLLVKYWTYVVEEVFLPRHAHPSKDMVKNEFFDRLNSS